MPLIKKRRLLLAKIESSPGVDPTPTGAANACLVEDMVWKLVTEPGERSGAQASAIDPPRVQGGRYWEVTFSMEAKGSGTAGTAPPETALLQGCGMKLTNTPATSDAYVTLITDDKTVTLYGYQDGKLYETNYAQGTFVLRKEGKKPARYQFTFKGLYVAPVDATMASPTFPTTTPVAVVQTLTLGGVTPKIKSWSIDLGADVQMLTDDTAGTGYHRAKIVGYNPSFTMQVEEELVATRDDHANALLDTGLAWDGTIGGTAGNKIDVNIPKCHINEVGPGEAEGVSIHDLSGQVRATSMSATDHLTLLYY